MKILKLILRLAGRYGWTAVLVVLGAFAVGFTWSSSDELYSNIRLFDRAAITITSNYVENLDERGLIKAGIDGMLSKLDPYSKFLCDADYLYLKQETDGEFEGIGVALAIHHDTLTVESVLDNSPGSRRGLAIGDRIISIDTTPTAGLEIRKVKMLLQGLRGSKVNLKINRPGTGLFDLAVERDKLEIKAISYYGIIEGNIGYAKLDRFSTGCADELHSAIHNLKKQGMKSLILDLRGNPGGLVIESAEIASMFLPENVSIVQTRGHGGTVGDSYASSGKSDFQAGGLVILVDSMTASAAEIVAGAIQDHDRGVIIGDATFGKGLVQQVMQFSDNTALKLTTAKYYLPSGRCLQKPDWSSFELVNGPMSEPKDSLFRTDSGRSVLSGGGIIPDIYAEEDQSSDYVESLDDNSCFFDFSLNYLRSHTITVNFKPDSTLMGEFRRFVQSHNIHFKTDQREALSELKKKLKEPSEKIKSALNTIDKELATREAWEFDSNYSQIASKLSETLIRQAFGETGLYRGDWLRLQPEIVEALNILSNNTRYSGILAIH